MADFTLYNASIPYFLGGLRALAHILKKAESHCAEKGVSEKELIEARLYEDMKPLPFQIQVATDTSRKALTRLANIEVPSFADTETTLAELQDRVAKTISCVEGAEKSAFGTDYETVIKVMLGVEREFSKIGYLQSFVLPNFYFHVVTAYDILRSKGVVLGKMDFLHPPQ